MNLDLLIINLTNPAFLFFLLGLIAVMIKSDLEIPDGSSKFISLYLLFAIGFKGGQELSHSTFTVETAMVMLFGIASSFLIPIYTFMILRRKLNISDSGAIAAAYGSVSAVTFVTAVTYLESSGLPFHGHLVATMALMESPAIISGLLLMKLARDRDGVNGGSSQAASDAGVSGSGVSDSGVAGSAESGVGKAALSHSFTNGSVVIILGSLVIGLLANAEQAEGIAPFTNELFKGFLSIFLLDMGITSGRKLGTFRHYGWFPVMFAVAMPMINGCLVALLSSFVTGDLSDRFMLAVLAASASYIAVPAAMKIAAPESNPGLYIPMSLAITFPFNITLGFPLYMMIAGM